MGLCDNAVLILHTGDKTQNESLKPAYNLDRPSDLVGVGVFRSLILCLWLPDLLNPPNLNEWVQSRYPAKKLQCC